VLRAPGRRAGIRHHHGRRHHSRCAEARAGGERQEQGQGDRASRGGAGHQHGDGECTPAAPGRDRDRRRGGGDWFDDARLLRVHLRGEAGGAEGVGTRIGMRTISVVCALFLVTQHVGAQTRAIVYTTAESTSFRLTPADTLTFKPSEPTSEGKVYVFVDPRKTFQPMIGIGGALTDAAAETFAKLPAARQEELLQAYYSADRGIGYTLGRTNINSCDFSSDMYTYVREGDSALTSFSVAHDLRFRIPLIRRAMAASGNRLKLFASPWSPPAFMKDNNDMLHGGHLRADYAHSWAQVTAVQHVVVVLHER